MHLSGLAATAHDQPEPALRTARTAVRLNPQDPQARINLSLAMLETDAKGVREHIGIVQRLMAMAPELADELQESMADGLKRRPGWAGDAEGAGLVERLIAPLTP